MEVKEALAKFKAQKFKAQDRGIEWKLTFHEWFTWWGDDLDHRGPGHDELQMQRIADQGPYALGNIRKGYPRDNASTRGKMQRLKSGALVTQTAHKDLMRLPAKPSESPISDGFKRELSEDEWELFKMFQPKFSRRMICTNGD